MNVHIPYYFSQCIKQASSNNNETIQHSLDCYLTSESDVFWHLVIVACDVLQGYDCRGRE